MPSSAAPVVVADAGRSSASTIAANFETGSHELTVSGYSGTKGLGVGKCILYYPDGFNKECADWISIYLELAGNNKVRARYRFSLLDQVGAAVPSFSFASSQIRSFNSSTRQWGYRQFIKRKDLESSPHLKDDSFRISCHVAVFTIRAEETTVHFLATESSTDLHRHLGDLLENKVGADVKFRVGGETFRAHRCVLAARSPVFKSELFGWLKEMKTADQVRIDDMEPRVFGAMLHFIYTDSLPNIDEADRRVMAQHLLVAADRYRLERLKKVCEDMLCNFIDTNTVAATLALAEQHGFHRLKERCLNFLKNTGNTMAAMATDGFEYLMSSCPSLIKDWLSKVAP